MYKFRDGACLVFDSNKRRYESEKEIKNNNIRGMPSMV